MKPVLLLILSLLSLNLAAKIPNMKWGKGFGGKSYDRANAHCTDASGNVYVTGYFSDTVDFDPGPGTYKLIAVRDIDLFILKLDPNGDFIWAKRIGSKDGAEEGNFVQVDAQGYVYVGGSFSYIVDFDPGTGSFGMQTTSTTDLDVFLLKLTSAGNFVWAQKFGSDMNEYLTGMHLDSLGQIYMAGSFMETVDFNMRSGTNNLTTTGRDGYVAKYDTAGAFIWARQFATTNSCWITSMEVDQFGSVYTCGYFGGSVDFDPGSNTVSKTSNGVFDAMVIKLNSAGNYRWAVSYGNESSEYAHGIAVDRNKNPFITGYFWDTCDFNPGSGVNSLKSKGSQDAYVLRLDSSGNFAWVKHFGSIIDDEGRHVETDAQGNVYCTGEFGGKIDFDPGTGVYELNSPNGVLYVLKLSNGGNFIWAAQVGARGSFYLLNFQISIDKRNRLLLSAYYNDSCDFDPDTSVYKVKTLGGQDAFITQWWQCTNSSSTVTANVCNTYTLNGKTYTSSGNYTQTLINKGGCDSTISIKLTIRKATSSTMNRTTCDSFLLNSQVYYTSGTYKQTLTNKAGCDSTITLNLTIKKSSSFTINQTACDSFILNAQTYKLSGSYVQHRNNKVGCDSSITLNLVLNYTTRDTLVTKACNSIVINNQFFASSGIYNQNLKNYKNCDSILIVALTINKSSSGSTNITSCDSAVVNGITYKSSGTYFQTLTNSVGCDSILSIQLTINKTSNRTLTVSSCKRYTLNGQTYNNTGIYHQKLQNSNGCDSMLTLDLTILKVDTTVTVTWKELTAGQANASYQWLDCDNGMSEITGATSQTYSPILNGSFAVAITYNGCTDTSLCRLYSYTNISEQHRNLFKVYPNPVSELLNMEFAGSESVTITLYTITGELITTQTMSSSSAIDMSTLPNGIYLLELEVDGRKFRTKVVK